VDQIIDATGNETAAPEGPAVIRAKPEMFKALWPEVRGSYFFHHRRTYLDFLQYQGGKIFYLGIRHRYGLPFILVGNWRDREDITAIWHIGAYGSDKKILVLGAARACFDEGSERMITKLLDEAEATEYQGWGFETACKIVLLEKQLYRESPPDPGIEGLRVTHFRKKDLDDVLRVDATAFDDFWRLDARTIEAIASSCTHNTFLLARRGGETLGYAMGGNNGRLGYLQRLGVDGSYQGRGIGELLASHLLHALYRTGAGVVMVNTQEDNATALNLYHSMGFSPMPARRFIMQLTREGMHGGTG
jgi:[ribosomal protein S18]-alanine N-acetyltransferase